MKDALDHASNEKAIEYYHKNTANIEVRVQIVLQIVYKGYTDSVQAVYR